MSELVTVERDGPVTVLRMRDGENRLRPASVAALCAALDELEHAEHEGALVLTGTGKFFSNGLDLDWIAAAPPGGFDETLTAVHTLLARLLAFPTVTVAAINGHAYAGGAMVALACDFRVMRADRGYFCLPEVDLKMPFSNGMNGLVRAKMVPTVATAAMTFGARYTAADAVAAGLVDEVTAESEVVAASVRRASGYAGKDRATLRTIKERLYAEPLAALRAEPGVSPVS